MGRPSALQIVSLVLLASALACSKSAPSEPSQQPDPPVFNTLTGMVAFTGGGTGLIAARAASSLSPTAAARPAAPLFERLMLIRPLYAQGSTAAGAITFENGTTVTLNGTHNAGTFQLSGDGYSATLSSANAQLSGTVTTPTGSGTVTPIGLEPIGPAPASPTGTYVGSYEMIASGYHIGKSKQTGAVQWSCNVRVRITGNVSVRFYVPIGPPDGTINAAILDDWTENAQVQGPCSNSNVPQGTLRPVAPLGHDYTGTTGNMSVVGGTRVERWNAFGGPFSRTHTFVGALGSSTIQARMFKTYSGVGDLSAQTAEEGYRLIETSFTLQRQN